MEKVQLREILKQAKFNKENGCLEWCGSKTPQGYARVSINGKQRLVHRVMWEHQNGAIPGGMYICHKCDNPSCIRPAHLFLGTPADNNKDAYQKGRNTQKGEKNGNNILSEKDVHFIRNKWIGKQFGWGEKKIFFQTYANIFGVSTSTIEKVAKNHRWKHI